MPEKQKSYPLALLLFFIPGLFLTAYSSYTVSTSLYHLIFWERTDGVILEFINDGITDSDTYPVKMKFTPLGQKELEVVTDKAVGLEGLSVGEEFTVFYHPTDPTRFQPSFLMMSYFLVGLFFPLGLLLIYLGWPFEKKPKRLFTISENKKREA
jgi:hypothetical protein